MALLGEKHPNYTLVGNCHPCFILLMGGCNTEIFGSTAKTHEQFAVVWIDNWQRLGEVGDNIYLPICYLKQPWLRVMARRGLNSLRYHKQIVGFLG